MSDEMPFSDRLFSVDDDMEFYEPIESAFSYKKSRNMENERIFLLDKI
jgi:hypothetical protein